MSNIFDDEELRVLKKTQKTRETVLDGYLKKGIDKLDAEDLDVVTKLLDSMDKQVHTNKRIALAKKDGDNNQTMIELAKRVILTPLPVRGQAYVKLDGFKDIETRPEELSSGREVLEINDFIRQED